MTGLERKVVRRTPETRFEKGDVREIVVSLEPLGRDSAAVGVRLSGTRQTFRIGVQSIYNLAVQHHVAKIEKRARELHKGLKMPIRTARARARDEMAKELR